MASLFIQLQIGLDGYVVPAQQVVRILPWCPLKSIPGAPLGIAGALLYGTMPVPVVDLTCLALNRPAARRFSTRILLTTLDDQTGPDVRLLGIIAEKVTHTIQLDEDRFVSSPVRTQATAYLGPIAVLPDRMLQRIDTRRLLPQGVLEALQADIGVSQ